MGIVMAIASYFAKPREIDDFAKPTPTEIMDGPGSTYVGRLESRKVVTLTFIERKNKDNGKTEILLGFKKQGFGKNLWNGFGFSGKVQYGGNNNNFKTEAVRYWKLHAMEKSGCAFSNYFFVLYRRIRQECGLAVAPFDLKHVGVIHFVFLCDPIILEAHVFRTSTFYGEIVESEEMNLKWWPQDGLPPNPQMWPDLTHYWFPFFVKVYQMFVYTLFRSCYHT
jgi:8-oxo-dGTP diphosphatase/2-hydroxy-dATP diphosphatase